MKTWIKNGLIGSGAGLILLIISTVINSFYFNIFNVPSLFITQFVDVILCGQWTPGSVGLLGNCNINSLFWSNYLIYLAIFFQIIIYFIFGVVVGLIIKKLKTKKI
jgi:hypothetical protein